MNHIAVKEEDSEENREEILAKYIMTNEELAYLGIKETDSDIICIANEYLEKLKTCVIPEREVRETSKIEKTRKNLKNVL